MNVRLLAALTFYIGMLHAKNVIELHSFDYFHFSNGNTSDFIEGPQHVDTSEIFSKFYASHQNKNNTEENSIVHRNIPSAVPRFREFIELRWFSL